MAKKLSQPERLKDTGDLTLKPRLKSEGAGDEGQPSLKSDKPEGDYLRQYQVRKQTVAGSPQSDPQVGSKAERMKKVLLEQSIVRMFIPRSPNESSAVAQTVNLNGYRLDFPKNTYVNVPKGVADVLGESLQQTDKALARLRIDGDKAKESALL